MEYEKAIKELENILQELENPNVGLDEAIKLFEKSVELSKVCLDKLNQTQGKVEIIKKQLDEIVIRPFNEIETK